MILDLDQFIRKERPFWDELEEFLRRQDRNPDIRFGLGEARRFHYLYQRAASDLAKIRTFAGNEDLSGHLQSLVARAYGSLHDERSRDGGFSLWRWFSQVWPQAFRRHQWAFWLAIFITFLGGVAGGGIVAIDPDNKELLVPPQFAHVLESPSERVAKEEEGTRFASMEEKAAFSTMLMQNNIKVSIKALAFGISYGILTLAVLFGNGVLLGIVGFEYVADGQAVFLAAWLLPHGVPELTAIFFGGQGGFVIARAVIGWGTNLRMRMRFRRISGDLVTLIAGAALMLIWAGLVEAFLSQDHEPRIAYSVKIAFGVVELVLLVAYFGFCGKSKAKKGNAEG